MITTPNTKLLHQIISIIFHLGKGFQEEENDDKKWILMKKKVSIVGNILCSN